MSNKTYYNSSTSNNSAKISTSAGTANLTYTTNVSPSLSATYTIPNYYTTTSSIYTSDYTLFDNDTSTYRAIIDTLTEDEINDLLDKFVERLSSQEDNSLLQLTIRQILQKSTRVFSEETILKYIKYLDIDDMSKYRPYIKSRQYSRLALYLEASK